MCTISTYLLRNIHKCAQFKTSEHFECTFLKTSCQTCIVWASFSDMYAHFSHLSSNCANSMYQLCKSEFMTSVHTVCTKKHLRCTKSAHKVHRHTVIQKQSRADAHREHCSHLMHTRHYFFSTFYKEVRSICHKHTVQTKIALSTLCTLRLDW